MPSTILSDNGASSGTAGLKTSGSNDGILELQTTTGGGTATAAITIDTAQRSKFPTTIGVGGATPATSGSGISFPASESASSDANTLDDYEEGTWTPVLSGTVSNPTVSYTNQVGKYTKIGNVVYCRMGISANITVAGSGNVKISLPFVAANLDTWYQHWGSGYVNTAAAQDIRAIGVTWNEATAVLYTTIDDAGASDAATTGTIDFYVQFFYFV